MQETLHDHYTSISTGGRPLGSPWFTYDIDLMCGSNGELKDLTIILVDRARTHGVEVGPEKSEIITISTKNIKADISMNGQTLDMVTSLKYLKASLCEGGTCSAEIRILIAPAMAAMVRLVRMR